MSSKINLQTCEYARKSSIFQDNQLICIYIYFKCGRKFRNPDELMAEVEAYQKRAKGFKIVGIIMSVLLLVAAAGMLINGIGIMALFFLILDAPFILCMRVSAYQVQSRKQELNEIMEGMQRMWQSESK